MKELLYSYLTDPVRAAPTLGSMLMCMVAGLVGCFAVLKRQSLVGEMLSHACYPGVVVALLFYKLFLGSKMILFICLPRSLALQFPAFWGCIP